MNQKVVIVGAGFGGIAAANALARAPVDVVLFDKQTHHLFQPLLYQVATAGLSPADIAWPIRRILRRQSNARVMMAEVTGIDTERKRVIIEVGFEPFDYLVLATGATHSWFGHDDWARVAPGLKDLVDATDIRRRILLAFEFAENETAENETAENERRRLMTFVVVGGGPTGVEMAGTIAELARKALATDFRRIDPRTTRVILVEAGDKLLPSFPAPLSDYAKRALTRLGVETRLGNPVTRCDAQGVQLGDEEIAAATIIWAAGVAASPVATWLQAEKDRNHRVIVGPRMEVAGIPQVFVVGDAARCVDSGGRVLPGVAAVAKQQGAFVGKLIALRVRQRTEPQAFRYRDAGQLATIGRRAAVADFGWLRFKGRLAWWFWGLVHIYFLINNRSRFTVAIHWLWSYVTFDRGARLIVREK
jgi:NADH dehydrogenase